MVRSGLHLSKKDGDIVSSNYLSCFTDKNKFSQNVIAFYRDKKNKVYRYAFYVKALDIIYCIEFDYGNNLKTIIKIIDGRQTIFMLIADLIYPNGYKLRSHLYEKWIKRNNYNIFC